MDQMLEHGIMDDLVSVGDKFPLPNGIHHEEDVVDWSTLLMMAGWGGRSVLVKMEGIANL